MILLVFSDPQSGKGACDRATSVIKRHVHQFVSENNKCMTAAEFFECANSYQGVSSATFIHAALQSPAGNNFNELVVVVKHNMIMVLGAAGKGSIIGITPYHNFDFTNLRTKGWYAYNIGDGQDLQVSPRTLDLPRLDPVHSVGTKGQKHNSILQVNTSWIPLVTNRIPAAEREQPPPSTSTEGWMPDDSDDNSGDTNESSDGNRDDDPTSLEGPNRKGLFQCEVEGCTKVFQSHRNWLRHITVGKHTKRVERQSLRDYSIDKYVQNIKQSQALSGLPQIFAAIESMQEAEAADVNLEAETPVVDDLPIGWALKIRRPTKQFSLAQRTYLTEKFNIGARSGIKHNPQDIAKMMRRDPQFPDKSSWLTWNQIASFWSRLAKTREQQPPEQQGLDSQVPQEVEIDLEAAGNDEYVNNYLQDIDDTMQAVIDEGMNRE
jgi:hypothetical protein